ncbi:MAG: DMT family transporter [Candidatus Eisenbacteria bacterium]|nr:DMT family transporter [Candidatus Eisenbacteria bacterium]
MSGPRAAGWTDTGLLLLVSLLWGSTFVAVKVAVSEVSPLLFVAVRFAIASLAALLLCRRTPLFARSFRIGAPIGLVYGAAYAAQTIGLTATTPSRSAFITALSVALVPFWGVLVTRIRPGWPQVLALLLTIPGLWLLSSPGADGTPWNHGDSWTVACAVGFALHIALIGRFAGQLDAPGLLLGQLVATTALAGASATFLEVPRITWSPAVVGALLLTSILATTVTTWVQLKVQPRVGSNRTALIFATEPVFGALFAYLVLGEHLTGAGFIGAGLILAAVLVSELSPRPN